MTHDRAHALLLDLAYGELSPDEAREVSRHAAECSGCAAELERIGAVRARTAPLRDGPEQAGDQGRDALVEAARRAVAGRPTRRWFTRPATLSLGAAAAVMAIVAGVTLKLTGEDLHPAGEERGIAASAPPAAISPSDVAAPTAPETIGGGSPDPGASAGTAPPRRPASRPGRETRAAPAASAAAPVEAERAPAPAMAAAPEAAPQARALAARPSETRELAAPAPAAEAQRARKAQASSEAAAPAAAERTRQEAPDGVPAAGAARDAAPDPARPWRLLEAGGQVILMRHAATEPGLGDPPGVRLGACSTQRNLSEAGREEARRLGETFRARGIPIGRVLSSRWCRCLETARLAFGRTEEWPALDSFFGDPARDADQTAAVRRLLAERPERGNLVLVTHQVNITALTGIVPAPGELVVLTPRADGTFTVAGRIPPPSSAE